LYVQNLEPGEHTQELYNDLRSNFPNHLPVQTAMLTSLDSSDAPRHVPHDDLSDATVNFSNQIITIADEIIKSVDQEKLLAYYGLKNDQRPDATKIKATMDKEKNCLLEALVKKGCALARLYVHGKRKNDNAENIKVLFDSVSSLWMDAQKFAEPTDSKVNIFNILLFKL
jgi:tripeptidyl-peptidase-2